MTAGGVFLMTMGLGPQVETCAEREGHGAVACKALGAVGPVRQNKVLCTSSRAALHYINAGL